jgi:hypothetical protein
VIRQLLAEAHAGAAPLPAPAAVEARGIGQAPDFAQVRTPETYLGYAHADAAAPRGLLPDRVQRLVATAPHLNDWSLGGAWVQRPEFVEAVEPDATLALRFHARDLHAVLGSNGEPVPFRVTIDGHPPGADHGVDVDTQGRGTISGERLYQLVRQSGGVSDRTVEIRFERGGARAWVFTVG